MQCGDVPFCSDHCLTARIASEGKVARSNIQKMIEDTEKECTRHNDHSSMKLAQVNSVDRSRASEGATVLCTVMWLVLFSDVLA